MSLLVSLFRAAGPALAQVAPTLPEVLDAVSERAAAADSAPSQGSWTVTLVCLHGKWHAEAYGTGGCSYAEGLTPWGAIAGAVGGLA